MMQGLLKALELLAEAAKTFHRRLFEPVGMRGDVRVFLAPLDGGPAQLVFEKNLIVNGGKTLMAKLLGGDAAYKNLEHLTKIAFGTAATAAAATQTALIDETFEKAATVSYPAFNQVMFSTTMEANEGGTSTYQELGLKSDATEVLFSRVVIPAIVKSTLYKIQVEWTISFQ